MIDSKFKNVKKHIFECLEEILRKLECTNQEQFRTVFDYMLERLKDLVRRIIKLLIFFFKLMEFIYALK